MKLHNALPIVLAAAETRHVQLHCAAIGQRVLPVEPEGATAADSAEAARILGEALETVRKANGVLRAGE